MFRYFVLVVWFLFRVILSGIIIVGCLIIINLYMVDVFDFEMIRWFFVICLGRLEKKVLIFVFMFIFLYFLWMCLIFFGWYCWVNLMCDCKLRGRDWMVLGMIFVKIVVFWLFLNIRSWIVFEFVKFLYGLFLCLIIVFWIGFLVILVCFLFWGFRFFGFGNVRVSFFMVGVIRWLVCFIILFCLCK